MHTFAQKPKATQRATSAKSTVLHRAHFDQSREKNSILHSRTDEKELEKIGKGPDTVTSTHFAHNFSQMPLHLKEHILAQPKLTVGTPGDRYEQEADRIADQVVSISEPHQQHGCIYCGGYPKRGNDASEVTMPLSPATQQAASFSGRPLDSATRGFMESRFGHDFSHVRVHSDDRAGASTNVLRALAYTTGNHIAFARGWYAPQQLWGARLLAHELAHVVQQQVSKTAPSIQLVPITGSQSSASIYELRQEGGSRRQVQTNRDMGGISLSLAYDPGTSLFTVTLPLVWIFAHFWNTQQRETYVENTIGSVRRVWNDKFLLTETRAPRRSAHVEIEFDNSIIPQMQSAAEEQAELAVRLLARRRWTMDVRNLGVRENVNRWTATVQLGERSAQQQRMTAAELRARASFAHAGTGGNRTFTQAAAPHEFGHMIGLGDEYLEDVSGEQVPSSVRGYINDRIMNVGENVTPDAYAPFAEWLSGLTSSTWRVGRQVR